MSKYPSLAQSEFTQERKAGDTVTCFPIKLTRKSVLGPACSSVTLVLYSEKEPTKADTRVVDPSILQQIRRDFELDGKR